MSAHACAEQCQSSGHVKNSGDEHGLDGKWHPVRHDRHELAGHRKMKSEFERIIEARADVTTK
jgi:hypothetical protein